ncbi:toprim domain-containing protein [Candidatus Vondammii sp. HM_W22]|uniref:toprim domain-containing protein n=1 Tax=Candidatus Vondammii sp. HM_W22 TaxID=2687299 RepID=UPI001F12B371|nr:toprim domain-containing protein [Candidatus Vondammii sp. HM_W22]
MERLVEEVLITEDSSEQKARKAHFNGSHYGNWWQPPGMQINKGDTIWLVEGCLDAIALHLNG